MISAGVDVNSVYDTGRTGVNGTGLMLAMSLGNAEVSRIILGSNSIKIDVKNTRGSTALHYACYKNRIECVKLLLEHPTCNTDIVKIENNAGETAMLLADKKGNHECSKLIRDYLENNDDKEVNGPVEYYSKSVDDLVEFITGGETQNKRKKEKRTNPTHLATSSDIFGHFGGNRRKKAEVGRKETDKGFKIKTKGDSGSLGKSIIDTFAKPDTEKHSEIIIHEEVPENNAIHTNLKKNKEKIEEKIVEKYSYFDKHKENIKVIIHTKSIEIKNLDSMREKSQDEKNIKLNEVDKLDKELSDLEIKMAKLKLKKTELLEESKVDDRKIEQVDEKKTQT